MDYSLIEQDLEETPKGKVYFIFRRGKPRKCKIGKSINSSKRIKGLQIGNHHELYVYATLSGYSRLEVMLHKYFKEQRIRKTEWFDIELSEVDNIIIQYNKLKDENDESLESEEYESDIEKNDESLESEEYESDIEKNDEKLESEECESDIEKKDNIQEDGQKYLIEEHEITIIKKKVYKDKNVVKLFICDHCKQTFSDKRYLTKHNKAQTCKKQFICSKCKKEFSSAYNLRSHLKRKTACTKKFICTKCDKQFPTSSKLQAHKNRKTPCVPDEIPIIKCDNEENRCQYCNKTYSNAYGLRRHQNESCDTNKNMQVLLKKIEEQEEKIALLKENASLREQLSQQSQINVNNK